MVERWVKDLTEKVAGKSKLSIGKIVKHPDGRKVKIINGQFWGTYGISNSWEWREIRKNGSLGRLESGYGW